MEEPGSSNKQSEAKVEEDETDEPENSVKRSEAKVENGGTDEPESSNKRSKTKAKRDEKDELKNSGKRSKTLVEDVEIDESGRRNKPTEAKDEGATAAGSSNSGGATYCIRYENNASKRWDEKELLVDKDWLDDLYPEGIYPGKQLQLPWTGKKGKTVIWNAVVSCKKQHLEDKKDKQPKSPKQTKQPKSPKQTKSKVPSKTEKGNYMNVFNLHLICNTV